MHESRADLIRRAAERAAAYVEQLPQRPVFPDERAVAGLDRLPTTPGETGLPAEEVLRLLDEHGSPATVASTAGRYFGFVTGGTEPVAAGAAVLAAAWDQNVGLPVMSPVGAMLDGTATRWAVELLGLPSGAIATFCGGASLANLTCLVTARDALLHRAGWDVDERGVAGSPPLRVVTSAEIHASVQKALRASGFGRAQVERAAVDDRGAVVPATLPPLDATTLLVLQAGNVNTGHSDPFAQILPAARAAGAWVHVDGAFGLWAAASERQRHLVHGMADADSWAVDTHKWLNVTYDSALAIVRDPADLRRSMAVDAPYLATAGGRPLTHLGLQMSQRARAVEVWAVLARHGRRGVAEIVDRTCDLAARMAETLRAGGAEVLVPQALNQVLVAFGDDATTDAVLAAVQADGTCWVGGTVWQGRHAIRVSVSDVVTTEADVDAAAAAILRCWQAVRP